MADLVASVQESRKAGLTAIRDHLASCLEQVEPDKAAPLAQRLAEVMKELDSLTGAKESKRDELARRRAARQAASSA